MAGQERKHLCISCALESTCSISSSGVVVHFCADYRISFPAILETDAVGAITKLIHDGRIEKGSVVRGPSSVTVVTVPPLPDNEIIQEMQFHSEIRKKGNE
jgi:hypothetical protein